MGEATYRVTTLGCRVNRADSIALERQLSDLGYRRAIGENPDLWVVNTCAVTAEGSRKSRKTVRRCARRGAKVVVTGCAVEMEPETFEAIPGVDAVVPNSEKERLAEHIREAGGPGSVPWRLNGMTRVPIKVQEGCDRYCTYCIVPYLRGDKKSRSLDSIKREVRLLTNEGALEIVLCGIDLGSYRDPDTGVDLVSLVDQITDEACGVWIRLSSLDITDISERLLSAMSEGRGLRRHLHVPLQSGDRKVLSAMGRGYTPERYLDGMREIRREVPGVSVTTDVMVGFPGETQEAFRNTKSVMEEVGFSRTHVFRYSPRPGTRAYELGDTVPGEAKEKRSAELRRMARQSAGRFNAGLVGRIMPVLVEGEMESEYGHLFGRSESFSGVVFRGSSDLVGQMVNVRIHEGGPEGLRGRIS